jgi:hypothetical protein
LEEPELEGRTYKAIKSKHDAMIATTKAVVRRRVRMERHTGGGDGEELELEDREARKNAVQLLEDNGDVEGGEAGAQVLVVDDVEGDGGVEDATHGSEIELVEVASGEAGASTKKGKGKGRAKEMVIFTEECSGDEDDSVMLGELGADNIRSKSRRTWKFTEPILDKWESTEAHAKLEKWYVYALHLGVTD